MSLAAFCLTVLPTPGPRQRFGETPKACSRECGCYRKCKSTTQIHEARCLTQYSTEGTGLPGSATEFAIEMSLHRRGFDLRPLRWGDRRHRPPSTVWHIRPCQHEVFEENRAAKDANACHTR